MFRVVFKPSCGLLRLLRRECSHFGIVYAMRRSHKRFAQGTWRGPHAILGLGNVYFSRRTAYNIYRKHDHSGIMYIYIYCKVSWYSNGGIVAEEFLCAVFFLGVRDYKKRDYEEVIDGKCVPQVVKLRIILIFFLSVELRS